MIDLASNRVICLLIAFAAAFRRSRIGSFLCSRRDDILGRCLRFVGGLIGSRLSRDTCELVFLFRWCLLVLEVVVVLWMVSVLSGCCLLLLLLAVLLC